MLPGDTNSALSLISAYGLAPVIFNVSATSGATVFLPSDAAIQLATPTLQLATLLFGNETFQHWSYNLLLQHVVDSFLDGKNITVSKEGMRWGGRGLVSK